MPSHLHPELRRAARLAPEQVITPVTLPMVRMVTRRMWRRVPRDVDALTLPSGTGVWLYRPPGATRKTPALLWIHGGGYVIGHPGQDDRLCRRFAQRLGITVASIDYRLAPEHPYPAGLDDCYSALTWLARLPSVDPHRIAIGGASAGGGLAASLAQLAFDRGEVALAAQLLVYPMLDDRTVDRRDLDKPGIRLWNRSSNKFGWSVYLGDADPAVAVPARRENLAGLAPAWIGVGTLDLFHDEDLAYAERLKAAGVPCDVHVIEGAFHGFDAIAPKAFVSQQFFDSQCAMLQRNLASAAA